MRWFAWRWSAERWDGFELKLILTDRDIAISRYTHTCEAGQRWKGWRFGGALSSVVVGPVLVLHLPCRDTLRRPRLKRSEVPLASCAFGFRWVVPGLAFHLDGRALPLAFCVTAPL